MFTTETLDFLVENRMRNSREWFHANKQRYRTHVVQPMIELVEALAPTMLQIDEQMVVEPKVGKCLSRINRDTRYTHDKSFYREVAWVVFARDKHLFRTPAFAFEFSPNGLMYGCGYYSTPANIMQAMRDLILEEDEAFLQAKAAFEDQSLFAMTGECYKRNRFADKPLDLQQWLNRKDIGFWHRNKDFPLLFSEELAETLRQGFLQLAPMYRFLCRCALRADSVLE